MHGSPKGYDSNRWRLQRTCYDVLRSFAAGTIPDREARQSVDDVKADLRSLRASLLGKVEEIQAYYREAMGEISARGHSMLGAVAGQKWAARARAEARRQAMREKNELLSRYRYAKLAINDLIRWIDGTSVRSAQGAYLPSPSPNLERRLTAKVPPSDRMRQYRAGRPAAATCE